MDVEELKTLIESEKFKELTTWDKLCLMMVHSATTYFCSVYTCRTCPIRMIDMECIKYD